MHLLIDNQQVSPSLCKRDVLVVFLAGSVRSMLTQCCSHRRGANPSRFTPRSELREKAETLRATSQTLQSSVSMLSVNIHDSTIRKNSENSVGGSMSYEPCK